MRIKLRGPGAGGVRGAAAVGRRAAARRLLAGAAALGLAAAGQVAAPARRAEAVPGAFTDSILISQTTDSTNTLLLETDAAGQTIASHTDIQNQSLANTGAHRINMSGSGLVVQYSGATPSGTARAWTTRLTIAPNGKMTIGGTGTGEKNLVVEPVNGAVGLGGWVGATSAPLALQPNGGMVGVGVSNPTERLHVVGNGRIEGNLVVTGTVSGTLPPASVAYYA